MYGSIVISMLTRKIESSSIDNIQDLFDKKSVRIFMKKHSFVHDISKSIPVLSDMLDRVEFNNDHEDDENKLIDGLNKILAGTHVLIEDKDNMVNVVLNALPQEVRCKFRKSKFHFSKTPVAFQSAGWLFNKKAPKQLKEMVNLRLMRLQATGVLKSRFPPSDVIGIFSNKTLTEDCPKVKGSKEEFCRDESSTTSLSIVQLRTAFLGLIAGYVLAFLAFIAECLVYKLQKPIKPVNRILS